MTTRNTGDADMRDPEDHPDPGDPDVQPFIDGKPSLRTLRGAFADVLPDATYQDFLDIKAVWGPKPLDE